MERSKNALTKVRGHEPRGGSRTHRPNRGKALAGRRRIRHTSCWDFLHMFDILVMGRAPAGAEVSRQLDAHEGWGIRSAPLFPRRPFPPVAPTPDLVLLLVDRLFPEGCSVLTSIRESGFDAPAIVMAPESTPRERALALALGA